MNVMTPSSREFYNIDEIWKNAERVDLSEVVSPEGPDDLLDDEDRSTRRMIWRTSGTRRTRPAVVIVLLPK